MHINHNIKTLKKRKKLNHLMWLTHVPVKSSWAHFYLCLNYTMSIPGNIIQRMFLILLLQVFMSDLQNTERHKVHFA